MNDEQVELTPGALVISTGNLPVSEKKALKFHVSKVSQRPGTDYETGLPDGSIRLIVTTVLDAEDPKDETNGQEYQVWLNPNRQGPKSVFTQLYGALYGHGVVTGERIDPTDWLGLPFQAFMETKIGKTGTKRQDFKTFLEADESQSKVKIKPAAPANGIDLDALPY